MPRTADGQQACGQACVAPPSKSRAKRRSCVGCGAALGAAVRGAQDAAVRRPSSSSPTNGYMPGRLKLHVMCNFGYLLESPKAPLPAAVAKFLGVFDHLSAKRSAKGAQKVQKRPKFLRLRRAGGPSAGPTYPLAVQLLPPGLTHTHWPRSKFRDFF